MAWVIKAIKPQKMNVDAIRREIEKVLLEEGGIHVKELKKTVATWKNDVGFDFAYDMSSNDASVISGPASGAADVWVMLDEGTKPHPIHPRGNWPLRFRSGYKAKTRPKYLGSSHGGAFGPMVAARSVHHPGTKPREWTVTLGKKRKRPFQRAIVHAVQRGTAKLY